MSPAAPFGFTSLGPLFRQPEEQRASDADRDTAVDILCSAAADGRLTLAELDERLGAALSARTLRQLAELIADLFPEPVPARPGPRSAPAVPVPVPVPVPGDRWAVLRRLMPDGRE